MCHVSPMESLGIDKHPSCDKSCLNNPFEMIHHRSNHAFSKTLILNAPESQRSNHTVILSPSLCTFQPSLLPLDLTLRIHILPHFVSISPLSRLIPSLTLSHFLLSSSLSVPYCSVSPASRARSGRHPLLLHL